MTQQEDPWNKFQARLQMYTYYGMVSWQVAAIFVAAAFILVTLPLTNLPRTPSELSYWRVWPATLAFLSELVSLLLSGLGVAFFFQIQGLANRWGGFLVDSSEKPLRSGISGKVLVCSFFTLTLSYNIIVILVLIMIFNG